MYNGWFWLRLWHAWRRGFTAPSPHAMFLTWNCLVGILWPILLLLLLCPREYGGLSRWPNSVSPDYFMLGKMGGVGGWSSFFMCVTTLIKIGHHTCTCWKEPASHYDFSYLIPHWRLGACFSDFRQEQPIWWYIPLYWGNSTEEERKHQCTDKQGNKFLVSSARKEEAGHFSNNDCKPKWRTTEFNPSYSQGRIQWLLQVQGGFCTDIYYLKGQYMNWSSA